VWTLGYEAEQQEGGAASRADALTEQAVAPAGEGEHGVAIGPDDADHEIVIYEDFLCPFCGDLETSTGERLDAAVEAVPTEASAQAIRCFRGETGASAIRRGRRSVQLSPVGALTFFFDPVAAVASAARLAAAVTDAVDLEDANEILHGLGVYTELDYERDALHTGT
jgi:hypothetical protein